MDVESVIRALGSDSSTGTENMFRFLPILLYCLNVNTVKASYPYFRTDYTYEPSLESFYKINHDTKSWLEARAVCEAEGSSLVMPKSKAEIDFLVKLMTNNVSRKVNGAHVGIHDMYAEGIFVTLEGNNVPPSCDYWNPGEPNNAKNREDCVHILKSGKYNDIDCSLRSPFICKKTLDTLTENPFCATSDLAYIPNKNTGSCYKLHLAPKTWTDAFATCHVEQSYLAIINSAYEAQFFKHQLANHPPASLLGDFFKDGIYLGFTDMLSEGSHITIQGTPVSQTGFSLWSPGQPDNAGGNENCGHLFRSGLLNDINCSSKLIFVCERDMVKAEEQATRTSISLGSFITN